MSGDQNPPEREPRATMTATAPPQRRPVVRAQSMQPLEPHVEQLALIGELMMGAAYADGHKIGIEVVAICEQLKEFVEAELLPTVVRRRLDRFDPAAFDVEAACARLAGGDETDRLAIVRLVATVTGADAVMHAAELAYVERVARAMGLDPSQLRISVSRETTRLK